MSALPARPPGSFFAGRRRALRKAPTVAPGRKAAIVRRASPCAAWRSAASCRSGVRIGGSELVAGCQHRQSRNYPAAGSGSAHWHRDARRAAAACLGKGQRGTNAEPER